MSTNSASAEKEQGRSRSWRDAVAGLGLGRA